MKYLIRNINTGEFKSPPSRGAWIEMLNLLFEYDALKSPPSRGAWIEIVNSVASALMMLGVAPLAGGVD